MAPAPAARPAATSRQRIPDSPPWLGRLRRELANCEDFFCRARARERFCSERWENLPECKGASL
ncbi:MAG: hypothetical protein LBF91_10045 [Azoarcus sp.]|jgi:hypothetical protein|nr:hypothetical protein [Azoarcus sp.]